MNLFKFLWSASGSAALNIVILSVINGISGGMLLILFPGAALNISSEGQYLFYAVTLPITTIVFLVSRHLAQQRTEALAGRAVEDMVLSVTNTVRHAELPAFEQFSQPDILMSISDAQTISDAAVKNMESLQAYITLLIGWLYIFFYLSPFFGLFLLGVRLLQILIKEMFRKIIGSLVREQLKEEKEIFTAFRNHLYGFRELKFNRSKSEDIFDNYLLPGIESCMRIRIRSRLYGAELMITGILTHLVTMACCTSFPMSLAPEDVTRIVIILFFVLQSDMLINSSVQNIAEGNAALEQLRRLFDPGALRKGDEDIRTPSRKPAGDFHSVTMDDIRFAYPAPPGGQGFSVRIENLTIRAGEILFIVGGNGNGKSTFMNILTGLYPPDEGVIKIDGHPVLMKEYRHVFSAVFADFHLFDRFYGSDAVDEARVRELLRLTELEGKIRYGQDGFTTLDLSTGQRKRLALVIAMIEDRPVFVFDEWAADQDPHFRHYFYENILPSLKKKGKTVIAITHDDRYFHVADKVIRMEYGGISEQWRPDREKPAHPLFSRKPISFSPKKKPHPSDEAVFRDGQDTGEKTERQDREHSGKGLLKQIRQIFREERDAVKKILCLLPLFAFSLVSLSVILIQTPLQGQAAGTQGIWIVLLLILMVTAFRRLQKTFYQAVENGLPVSVSV
ncbi:MAG: hypothetical protein B6245_13185 [Desulfobacteraceae bacterium 4572_88]|nr:MAG: hypothetical protein B6245_13185 [Desulfobacteraceae bacterium 4572_88]